MDSKTRLILPVLMSGVMVFMVTLVVTYLNLRFQSDFISHWMRAYFIAWPIAAIAGITALPFIRRVTDRIVGRIEGRRS